MTVKDLLSTLDGEVVATIKEDDMEVLSIRAAGWGSLDDNMKKKEVKKWSLKNFAHIIVKLYPGGGLKDLDGDGIDDTIATDGDIQEVIDAIYPDMNKSGQEVKSLDGEVDDEF